MRYYSHSIKDFCYLSFRLRQKGTDKYFFHAVNPVIGLIQQVQQYGAAGLPDKSFGASAGVGKDFVFIGNDMIEHNDGAIADDC